MLWMSSRLIFDRQATCFHVVDDSSVNIDRQATFFHVVDEFNVDTRPSSNVFPYCG